MSLKVKTIASAQGVGSSASVTLRTTPFEANDSGMLIIEPSSTNDRSWDVEYSDDEGSTWNSGETGNGSDVVHIELKMHDMHRLTVSGGTVGTVTAKIAA